MWSLPRYLEAPLLSLTITLCQISQSDLESFSQHWNYGQLKHLCLKGVSLSTLNVTPLKFFLESVADTLQTLELEDCRMKDSHLRILLPALTKCTRLTSINFYDNNISRDVLQDLLHRTANMSQLTMELYPAPVEVYNEWSYVQVERFFSALCWAHEHTHNCKTAQVSLLWYLFLLWLRYTLYLWKSDHILWMLGVTTGILLCTQKWIPRDWSLVQRAQNTWFWSFLSMMQTMVQTPVRTVFFTGFLLIMKPLSDPENLIFSLWYAQLIGSQDYS